MSRIVLVLWFLIAGAHAHDAHKHGAHKPVPGVTSLDVYRDGGNIHVLTGEMRGEATSLWHRRSSDGGRTFAEPVRVNGAGKAPTQFRRGDDAQIAARGDTVVALWSVPGTGWGGSGPLASALSRDGGKTWSAASSPSDSGLTTGHGFADLMFGASGLHAVWLDGRDKAQGLRYAHSKDGSRWEPSITVAAETCECCWNSLAARGPEVLVMFRGAQPRDMELAALRSGRWARRAQVGAFDWRIKGCPETGGGLALASDGTLHALVWTGAERNAGLHHLASADGGAKWSNPVRMGGADAQHADLAASGNLLAAAWDDADAVLAAVSRDRGATWEKPVRLSAVDAMATHPRIVPASDGFLVLWTERAKDAPWRLRTAIVR